MDGVSMSPALRDGDRVVVLRAGWAPRRGEVVVADVAGTWAPAGDRSLVVKRVVGLPGEVVACCDGSGRLTVDGRPLDESAYLREGTAASAVPFTIAVPAERVLLLGDARDRSDDARAHLGGPGGGTVGVETVVGRAVLVGWPPGRLDAVERVLPLVAVAAG